MAITIPSLGIEDDKMATKRGLMIGLVLFVVVMMVYLMRQTPDSASLKEVPDFALPLAAPAQPTRLSALRGKVVILDFWATWCGPCKLSMPHLEKMYKKYKDRGLVVIGISEDDATERAAVEAARKDLGVTYPTAMAVDMADIAGKFPHEGIPALYLIDKEGKLADSVEGFSEEYMDKLDRNIDEMLAK
jgi:thiol-disulfide isomerase/thioredoxin